jgi:hypothetical protein
MEERNSMKPIDRLEFGVWGDISYPCNEQVEHHIKKQSNVLITKMT